VKGRLEVFHAVTTPPTWGVGGGRWHDGRRSFTGVVSKFEEVQGFNEKTSILLKVGGDRGGGTPLKVKEF